MKNKQNIYRAWLYGVAGVVMVILFVLYQNSLEKEDTSMDVLSITENPVSKYTLCSNDSDCARVANGACQCNSGGKGIAINKKYKQQYEIANRKKFAGIGCWLMASDHITCTSPVKCINNQCTIQVE